MALARTVQLTINLIIIVFIKSSKTGFEVCWHRNRFNNIDVALTALADSGVLHRAVTDV